MGGGAYGRTATSQSLHRALIHLGCAAIALAAVEIVLVVEGPVSPTWVIVLFPVGGLLYAAAGLVAWWRRPSNRLGALLVLGAVAWFLAGLANTDSAALIAVGQIFATLLLAVVLHMLLAFPSGRLPDRLSRALAAAGYVVSLVLQAPLYLFAEAPDPYGTLAVADRPGLVDAGQWVQWVAGAAVVATAAVVLARRLREAAPAQRRVLAPLAAYGIAAILFIPLSSNVLTRIVDIDPVDLVVMQIAVLAVIPFAFALGVLRGGFARTGELEELGAWLGAGERARPGLQAALADALGDPTVRLVFWVPDRAGYVGADGSPAQLPRVGASPAAVEVELAGERVGAIVYDSVLIADPALVRAAGRVIAIALDRERLTAQLLASREALRESRARIVEAGDRERRRIARDLHDGLQGRLVLLALAAQRIAADGAAPEGTRQSAASVRGGLDESIAELRRLVHGVLPPVLAERGLMAATEDLCDRLPIPTDLDLDGAPGSLPAPVESAAYFVVAESLANAVKHSGARELSVRLGIAGGSLHIEVSDDGVGGADVDGGTGLRGIADRIDVLGGRLALDSPPGHGTRLTAEVPCAS